MALVALVSPERRGLGLGREEKLFRGEETGDTSPSDARGSALCALLASKVGDSDDGSARVEEVVTVEESSAVSLSESLLFGLKSWLSTWDNPLLLAPLMSLAISSTLLSTPLSKPEIDGCDEG